MERLVLPLMMFGKLRGYWHKKGEYVRHKVKVGVKTIKSGPNKGRVVDDYEWQIHLKKKKVIVGHTVYKAGPKKGQQKPIYETQLLPYESVGYFPSENAIYMNIGGGKRLSPMAEEKLQEWKSEALEWQKRTGWVTAEEGKKVIAVMWFYFPDEKIRDTHNGKKLLMDSLEGVIHKNDMWILDRTQDFGFDPDNPRIEILFMEVNEHEKI
jgi:crossover junction endodeoxyribonuclease RusA